MKLINSRLPAGYSHEDIDSDDRYLRRGDGTKDKDVGGDDDHDGTSDQQQQIITIVSSPRCPSDS